MEFGHHVIQSVKYLRYKALLIIILQVKSGLWAYHTNEVTLWLLTICIGELVCLHDCRDDYPIR